VLQLDVSLERSAISAALQANFKEAVEAMKDKSHIRISNSFFYIVQR
jgi:hypothetical protein